MPLREINFKKSRVPFLTGLSKTEPRETSVAEALVSLKTQASLPVRSTWLRKLNRRSQEFVGRFVPGGELPASAEIRAFVRTLSPAANAAETSLLKARLLDLAFRWSALAHARFHGNHRCSCLFTTLEPLARTWRGDPVWNDGVAAEWAAACAGIGERLRAREEARRLASVLVERHRDAGAATSHAHGAEVWTVTRTFRDEFGCTPHDFLTRIRIAKAVPMLAMREKTEVVALEVGYRSKKTLFGALKRLTGLRPSEVAHLSSDEIAAIVERLDPARN